MALRHGVPTRQRASERTRGRSSAASTSPSSCWKSEISTASAPLPISAVRLSAPAPPAARSSPPGSSLASRRAIAAIASDGDELASASTLSLTAATTTVR